MGSLEIDGADHYRQATEQRVAAQITRLILTRTDNLSPFNTVY
jgi:hypothetical protein